MDDAEKLDAIYRAVTTPTAIQVAEQGVEIESLRERVKDLEDNERAGREWKRGPMLMAGVALCAAVAADIILLVHG